MEISYQNKKLRELCERRVVTEKKLGPNSARKLMLRLQALEAATRVTDLTGGNPHPLVGDREGEFSLDLANGRRLTFVPTQVPHPTKADGSIDWKQITAVTIHYIGDYHD